MISKYFKSVLFFFTVLFVGSLMLPNFSFAATSSLQIHQQAGDVVPDPGGVGGGGLADTMAPQISEVSVTIKFNSAIINWKTVHEDSTSKLAWGRNQDYSDGVISSSRLLREHSEQIDNLLEKQLYYFLITAIDSSGNQSFYSGQFITGSKQDLTPPLNVNNFVATPYQGKIDLSWNNPTDLDFMFTRIVRSTIFFPTDPFNGRVIYEGTGQQFTDTDVNTENIYYYTAFTRDLSGNYSSGALASAKVIWFSESGNNNSGAPVVDLKFIYDKNIPEILLTVDDFNFSYKNGQEKLSSRNVVVPASENLFISIDKRKLQEGTKFLMWNSRDGSYLFSFNPQTGNYELTLPALTGKTQSSGVISIFNSASQIIQDVPLTIKVSNFSLSNIISNNFWESGWFTPLSLIILCLLLWLFFFLWKRRKKDHKGFS